METSKPKDKNAQNKQVLHAETTAYLSRVPLAIHHNIWYTRMSSPSQCILFLNKFLAVCTFNTKLNFAKGKLNRELSIGTKVVFGAPLLFLKA